MGACGFGLVRPVHVTSLLKRYRQLLGETRYWTRRLPHNDKKVLSLTTATASLAEGLSLFEVDFSTAKPIPYRPPEPLDQAELRRAVLTAFRCATTALAPHDIARTIATKHKIDFINEVEESRFVSRVERVVNKLAERKIIVSTHPLLWHLPR